MRKIEICGSGCEKFFETIENVRVILNEKKITVEVKEVIDRNIIAAKGVTNMPAVVVDGKIVSQGKSLSKQEVKQLIECR